MKTPSDVVESTDDLLLRKEQVRAARAKQRLALIDALDAQDRPDLARRLEKCGEPLGLTCTNCGERKMAFKRCDLKWCPSCAPLLAHFAVQRYTPICAEFLAPLFVTLTVKNYTDRVGLRDLRRAFTALRRHRWFKKCVRGGVASFEVTNRGKGWHPHAHALMDCRWLAITVPRPAPGTSTRNFKHAARRALTEVAAAWSDVLGRAGSVAVRAVFHRDAGDPTAAMREVLKYSAKPADLIEQPDSAALIDQLSLSRNLVSWGSAYRHPTLKKQRRESCPCDGCSEFGTFMPDDVIARICRTS